MSLGSRARMWLRAMFRHQNEEREMERELAAHIAMEQERLEGTGLPPGEARRQAMIAFGGVERYKEAIRDQRGVRLLENVAQDFRIAVRGLPRRPAFTLGVVATLAIGIGATTAVFGWANWLLFRPVPGIAAPERVVPLTFINRSGTSTTGVSYPGFLTIQRSSPLLREMTAQAPVPLQIGRDDSPPRSLRGEIVVGDFFGVLGVTPSQGRFFTRAELDPSEEARVVVISDALWRAHFGATGDIVGRTAQFNATGFTIIGVAPRDFHGISRTSQVDAWFPASANPLLRHSPRASVLDPGRTWFGEILVRRSAGVAPLAVQAATRQATVALDAQLGADAIYGEYPATIDGVLGISAAMLEFISKTVRILLGIVALVLLIACANTANLLFIRSIRRRSEFGVRRALGASNGRLLLQHTTEGVLLAVLGACAGVGLALVLSRIFSGASGAGLPAFDHLPVDWRVIAFVAALCGGSALVFSVVPWLVALRRGRLSHLDHAGRSEGRSATRVRAALTVLQTSVAMTLVVAALLLARTVDGLGRVALGFDPAGVSVFSINTDAQGYSVAQLHTLRTGLVDWMAHQPGVNAAAVGRETQFSGSTFNSDLRPVGFTGKAWPVRAASYAASPGYFATLRIAMRSGRTFTADEFDDSTSASVILGENAARQLFGTGNPIGQYVENRGFGGVQRLTVIGVVADTRVSSLRDSVGPTMYTPAPGPFQFAVTLLVRSTAGAAQVARQVREALDHFDPSLPVTQTAPLSDNIARSIARERLFGRLLGALAAIAALLSAVGLYSVIAYSVTERTREIGVRMALGAHAARVVRRVLRQGIQLAMLGIIIGTAGAYALSRILSGLLFGVSAADPPTYLAAAVVALAIGVGACAIPARAATRINPVEALRSE